MKCQNFLQKHCLSCDLLSHEYSSSVALKEQKLFSMFPEQVGKIKASVICDRGVQGSRNKAKLAVAMVHDKIEFGFYDNNLQFKKLEDCPLHAPAINAALGLIKKELALQQVIPYNLFNQTGELKYVLITYSETANELLLRFVLRSKHSLHQLRKVSNHLLKVSSAIKVVTVNIQPIHQAILEGNEEIVLTENDSITHHFDEYSLFQGPRSFFQTNSMMAQQLYHSLQQKLSELSINHFLDLYCGVGAFSFFAEKYCSHVVGVEISDAAISYANQARVVNNSAGIAFMAMDVEDYLKKQQASYFDAILVNPPRRGLNESILNHIIRLAPDYLFYSSCHVDTLYRDVQYVKDHYKINSLQLFDMFPFTKHFETLAVLTKV